MPVMATWLAVASNNTTKLLSSGGGPDMGSGRARTAVLDEAWPHLSKALAVQGRKQLEPILAANKPAWLASLQLSRCRPSGMEALHAFLLRSLWLL